MANTGTKIVLTLKEVYDHNSAATGVTKQNATTDVDYIEPSTDVVSCPVTYTTTCPTVVATGQSSQAEFEFALLNSVINNPAIQKVQVRLKDGTAATVTSVTFTLPHSNYFTGTLAAVAGTYSIDIAYLQADNTVVDTCAGLATITIT